MDRTTESIGFLTSVQNADGGWGYYPGKRSWLEPTCWAAIALGASEAGDRAFRLVRSLQMDSGAWAAGKGVAEASWSGALALLLHGARGSRDDAYNRGLKWLVDTEGDRAVKWWQWFLAVHFYNIEDIYGWPWREGNFSWIEPTVWGVVALRKALRTHKTDRIVKRIAAAEKLIMTKRCRDGGWNQGNPTALGKDLPAYPESTALALIALHGNPKLDVRPSLDYLRDALARPQSRSIRAWLSLAGRMYGLADPVAEQAPAPLKQREVIPAAIELIARPEGAWKYLAEDRS
jgi:hypothetical protein